MTGVKFSRFTFKGIVYKYSRAQTRRGVVTPRRRVAFRMEVCFGIVDIKMSKVHERIALWQGFENLLAQGARGAAYQF